MIYKEKLAGGGNSLDSIHIFYPTAGEIPSFAPGEEPEATIGYGRDQFEFVNSRFEPELVDPTDPDTYFLTLFRENTIGAWTYAMDDIRCWFPLDYYLSIPDQQISFGKPIFRSDILFYYNDYYQYYCWYIPNSYDIFQANNEYKVALTKEKPEFDTTFKEYDYALYFTQDITNNSFTHTVYFTKANNVFLTCEYKSINTDTYEVITTATFSCTPEKYKPLPTDKNVEMKLQKSIPGLLFGNIYEGPYGDGILDVFAAFYDTVNNASGTKALRRFFENIFLTNAPLTLTLKNEDGDATFYEEIMRRRLHPMTDIYNLPTNHSFSLDNLLDERSLL